MGIEKCTVLGCGTIKVGDDQFGSLADFKPFMLIVDFGIFTMTKGKVGLRDDGWEVKRMGRGIGVMRRGLFLGGKGPCC